jgi:hypothetical protein
LPFTHMQLMEQAQTETQNVYGSGLCCQTGLGPVKMKLDLALLNFKQ